MLFSWDGPVLRSPGMLLGCPAHVGYHPSPCHSSVAQLQTLPKFVFYFTYILKVKNAESILQAKGVDCVLSLMNSSAEGTEWDPQPLAL